MAPKVTTSGTLDGSIIATIIRSQPSENRIASTGTGATPPSWCRYGAYGEADHAHRLSQASADSATSDPARIARSRFGSRRWPTANIARRP